MRKTCVLYSEVKIMDKSYACVCVLVTGFRCFLMLVFYPARVPSCSGVIMLVRVPS